MGQTRASAGPNKGLPIAGTAPVFDCDAARDGLVVYDLYCGLGGWTEGFLANGYKCIGYDIEAHDYGTGGYPGELRLRDVRSLHGSELKDATCIVGSSPCQEFSYRAMPWKRAKALPPPYLGMELFQHQFRIQREASEAAARHIPMVVENVRGAEKWVGPARWHFGSYYLWGDVPAIMPMTLKATKVPGFRFDGSGVIFQTASVEGYKAPGNEWKDWDGTETNKPASVRLWDKIAKIPFPLADWIAKCFLADYAERTSEARATA